MFVWPGSHVSSLCNTVGLISRFRRMAAEPVQAHGNRPVLAAGSSLEDLHSRFRRMAAEPVQAHGSRPVLAAGSSLEDLHSRSRPKLSSLVLRLLENKFYLFPAMRDCNDPRIYTPKIPTTKNFSQESHVMMSVMCRNPTKKMH
jgi:hypothetical protein